MHISEWLLNSNMSQAAFARIIGRDPVRAHRIIKQGSIPNADEMQRIYAATNGKVTANDFYNLPINGKKRKK